MSDELRMAFGALMEALDKELSQKEARINDLIAYTQHLDVENNKLRQNLKNTAGILASAAHALSEGLNDY
jgi:regulator of replication initiation timing